MHLKFVFDCDPMLYLSDEVLVIMLNIKLEKQKQYKSLRYNYLKMRLDSVRSNMSLHKYVSLFTWSLFSNNLELDTKGKTNDRIHG